MTWLDTAGNIVSQCLDALSGVSQDSRNALADAIIKARTVFVFGVGRSGLVAQSFAVRMVQLGLKVYFIGDMTTPLISDKDLVILVSNSGDTMSVVKTAEIARRLETPVFSVTGSEDNNLARVSNQNIVIASRKRDGSTSPLGTVFEDATMLFFDSMVPQLMDILGVTEEDMRARHAIWV